MVREEKSIQGIDWALTLLYLAFVTIGWLTIYAVGYGDGDISAFSLETQHGKQLLWIGSAFILGAAILIINYKFYITIPYLLYGIIIIALLATALLAPEVKGSRSWFDVGPFRIQPAEFAKFATALAVAKYLTEPNLTLKTLKSRLIAGALVAIPTGLIILQGDTGSALVFVGLFIALYRKGFPAVLPLLGLYLLLVFIITIAFGLVPLIVGLSAIAVLLAGYLAFTNFKFNRGRIISIAVALVLSISFAAFVVQPVFYNVLKDHQRSRINVLLGKEFGEGADYNVLQSKIAIGSGGLTGKGFLQGTLTKGDFVPEQSTDFIFSTLGEEWGFIGTGVFITLFVVFLLRLMYVAERQRSDFTRIYGYGVASIFLMHFLINVGMTIGLLPVVGIPLPFISYGGSSLWSFTILLFIFLKLDANRRVVLR